MFKKLANNYKLSNIVVKIFFVVAYVLCKWQENLLIVTAFMPQQPLVTMIIVSVLAAILISIALPIVVSFALSALRLYNVPRAEYTLIVQFFVACTYFVLGLLNLLNLAFPFLLGWSSTIVPLMVSLAAVIVFYKVTANLYFNDVTKVFYFKWIAILYVVIALLLGVL